MHLLSKCFFCNPKLYLPVTSFFMSVISRVWQNHRKWELRPWHGLSHLALAASDTHAVLHSPGSGHTKSSLRYCFDFSFPRTSSASSRFAYRVTPKLFPWPLRSFRSPSFHAGCLPCPTGLPAILLTCLEFSHSVACVLFFLQSAIFSSESLLGIRIKNSGKVLSSW